MKLGTNIRNWGPHSTVDTILECAHAADRSELDAVWVNDHLLVPTEMPSDLLPDLHSGRVLEPLASVAFLAAATARIRLGVAVLVAPYRPAVLTAKWIATLQELSKGRFLLGIGPGYLKAEFRALGLDDRRRGAMTDGMLEVVARCFAADEVELNGERVFFRPRPSLPPIYVGGTPAHAWSRAIRFGAGWIPAGIGAQDLKSQIPEFREQASKAGRPRPEVVAMKTLPLDEPERAAADALAFAEAGVDQLVHTQGYANTAEYRRVLDLLGEHIRPVIANAKGEPPVTMAT